MCAGGKGMILLLRSFGLGFFYMEGFLVGEHVHEPEAVHVSSTGTEVPAPGTLPDLALGASSSVSFVMSLKINWST